MDNFLFNLTAKTSISDNDLLLIDKDYGVNSYKVQIYTARNFYANPSYDHVKIHLSTSVSKVSLPAGGTSSEPIAFSFGSNNSIPVVVEYPSGMSYESSSIKADSTGYLAMEKGIYLISCYFLIFRPDTSSTLSLMLSDYLNNDQNVDILQIANENDYPIGYGYETSQIFSKSIVYANRYDETRRLSFFKYGENSSFYNYSFILPYVPYTNWITVTRIGEV